MSPSASSSNQRHFSAQGSGTVTHGEAPIGNWPRHFDINKALVSPHFSARPATHSRLISISASSRGTGSPVKFGVSAYPMPMTFQPLAGLQLSANSPVESSGLPIASTRAWTLAPSVDAASHSSFG